MTTTETVRVSTRSGNTVHLGYVDLSGTRYFAMCGQSGRFGRSYRGEINCTKCIAAHGQGSAALEAAKVNR